MDILKDLVSHGAKLSDEDKAVFSFAVLTFLKLLAPVLPHMTEEIYEGLGGTDSIHNIAWPEYKEELAKTSKITLVAQINGKVKDKTTGYEIKEGKYYNYITKDEMQEVLSKVNSSVNIIDLT